jgi:predicted house-cleaning NTP pyrophosphatase (Maf/HAM1 superfamily)
VNEFVYLASQSPRRRQLLEQLGVRYELLLPDDHEDPEALEAVQDDELPRDYVERVTRAKLQAAQRRRPSSAPTPRSRSAAASWESRPMRRRPPACCAHCPAARTAC